MRKKSGIRSVFLFCLIPLILLGLSAIPFFNNYLSTSKQTLEKLTVLGDGRTAIALTQNPSDSYAIVANRLNIAKETSDRQRLPSSFFRRGFIYSGSDTATIIIPQPDDSSARSPFFIYSMQKDGKAKLLDTLYAAVFDEPFFWQGKAMFLGQNESGQRVIDFVENGVLTQINLENDPLLANNIQTIRIDSSNYLMPYLAISTYDNNNYFYGLFFNEDGTLVKAASDGYSIDLTQLSHQYYGDNPMITFSPQEDSSATLGTYHWGADVSLVHNTLYFENNALIPLGEYRLFNPQLNVIDVDHFMISGTDAANPNGAKTLIYIFNRQTGELQQLPEALVGSLEPVFFNSSNYIDLTAEHIIINSSNGQAGVILDINSNQADFIVEASFPQPPLQDQIWGFITDGGGQVILIIAASWILLPILITVFGLLTGKSRKKKLNRGVQVIATITAIDQTGTYINNLPHVTIHLSFMYNGEKETAKVKYLVRPGQILEPGMALPASYDPRSKSIVLLTEDEVNGQSMQEAYNQTLLKEGVTTAHALDLGQNGLKAQGVIMSFTPTGKIINGLGEIEIKLRVTTEENYSYDAVLLKVVPPAALPSMAVGRVLDLRYNPADLQDITIILPVNGG